MARALFICAVVETPGDRPIAYPATEDLRNDVVVGNFPCVWTITKFRDTRRVAIGIAEVTAAQLTALQADSRIRAISLPDGWKTMLWGSVALATRNSIINFLNNRGVDTSDLTDDVTIGQIVNTLCHRFRAGRRAAHLESELNIFRAGV